MSQIRLEPQNIENPETNNMDKLLLKILIILLNIFLFANCRNPKNKIEKREMNGYIVEAVFKSDGIIDGIAKFYQKDGRIVSVINYNNGKKDGVTMNYYLNGMKSDSMNFSAGFKNGFQYRYDSLGKLYSINFEYFGLRMGPQIFLDNDIVKSYFYSDFNKEDLIECSYDSAGQMKEVTFLSINPRIAEVEIDGRKMLELFFYLPNPSNAEITYNVGLTDENRHDRQLFSVNNSSVIFDTILPRPAAGLHYYVSAHLKNKRGSVNKLFIEEVR